MTSYSVFFAKYNYNNEVQKDKMARWCSLNCGEEEAIYNIGGNNGRKETKEKDHAVGFWIILKLFLEK
jgi:hypothetical protein